MARPQWTPAITACRPLLGLRAGGNVREVITCRIRGTGARYRRSIGLLLARLVRSGYWSTPRCSEHLPLWMLSTINVSPFMKLTIACSRPRGLCGWPWHQ